MILTLNLWKGNSKQIVCYSDFDYKLETSIVLIYVGIDQQFNISLCIATITIVCELTGKTNK